MATGARPLRGVSYQQAGARPRGQRPVSVPPGGGSGARARGPPHHLRRGARRRGSRGTQCLGAEGDAGHGASPRCRLRRSSGSPPPRSEIRARSRGRRRRAASPIRSWAGLPRRPRAHMRYGLAGHWRMDTRDRARSSVTLAGGHEWYEAPVGPELLLVSILSHRTRRPITARTYEAAARRSIPALRDAELVSGPLGAAQFHQRVRAVAGGACSWSATPPATTTPPPETASPSGCCSPSAWRSMPSEFLGGRISAGAAAARYAGDHADLVRERRRLTGWRCSWRGLRHSAAGRSARAATIRPPSGKLIAINCGYQTFRDLTPRDWLSLAGI